MNGSALPDDLLSRATRCFFGSLGPAGPEVTPMAFWSDGEGLWMSAATANLPAVTGPRETGCVAYVLPSREHGPGAVVRGSARVYSLRDPLGLVLHTATISAAMTALAASHPASVLGYVRDVARAPLRVLPRNRVVLRLVLEQLTEVDPPDPGPGVAPALPTVAPADVRRALAGVRRLVLFYAGDAGLQAAPAVWGAGYTLSVPPSLRPPPGARAVAVVDAEHSPRPMRSLGLAVHGEISADSRLVPERVTSWYGLDRESAEVPAPAPGGVVLPD